MELIWHHNKPAKRRPPTKTLNTGKFLRETSFSLPEIWDWDRGSPFSRTMTKHTAKATLEWFKGKHWNILEWPRQWPDLNQIENMWYDLKIAVHQRNQSYLKELEQFCLEELAKIPVARCAKFIETYPKDLQLWLLQKVALQSVDFGGVNSYARSNSVFFVLFLVCFTI